jgi:DNA polymerase-3 subunit gamma/tau
MPKKEEGSAARTALYRKYRPNALKDVVGQAQVTDVLVRSLQQGKIAHAYLLTGPRGVGKTSIARILAHEINQLPYGGEETHLDIIEIDAASNNGVEDVRDLRDKVQLTPIAAAKKVYIIDEVHMLSKPAFNALLKTLEEPPAHVVFILATTDLHKVPATIISRTQHFAFHSITPADLSKQLKSIAKSEKMTISDEAIDAIATRGDGSFRDSISLLDQLSSFADDKEGITLDLVQSTLGLPARQAVDDLLKSVDDHDVPAVISKLDSLEKTGIQPAILADQLIRALRDQLAQQPQAVVLLDALLEVASSSQPQLKILTTLVAAAKPKTAAATATKPKPQPTVLEAPVIIVEKVASDLAASGSPRVSPARVTSGWAAPASSELEEGANRSAGPETSDLRSEAYDGSGVEKTVKDFDWKKVIDYIRENQVALYSVLSKCDVTLDGSELTIYAIRKFNKTKLDEPKYLTLLHEALEAAGYNGLTIHTLPTSKPLEDERLRKVAAMMGGGQEVPVEEQ